ncbi:RNA polymerase sigma factor [Hymenobacter jeollabukensis]|uniref:Sigma-70 family RNA polymerase sigma factor n=1 Tax=Hymenobacter jeollabukensis TaxID=2025313 RepID=A0A5R8WR98_9BACT|nr:sigma-70 family RNA polymerase sigma factor [Hymenobacter jeollabukensis]TLM93277.1 sigma-70 family RNA polymerase sigma factor [Hymenobacter jeollabukensis]
MSPATAPLSADFTALIGDNQPLLQRVCRMYCADADDRQDLYQEIVLQLWRAWPQYRPGAAKVSTWLYRVALNVAVSDLRRRTRHPAPGALDPEAPYAAPPPEGPDADDLAQLYRAIEQLSSVEKAFVLLYLEDRSYEEMADILGLTQNNVRVKMHRVQDKLRQLLTQPA